MDAAFVRALFRLMGTVLMMTAGAGTGILLCENRERSWRRLYAWSKLFLYLNQVLSYQALTGEELLERAKTYPEFADLGLETCTVLEQIPLPETLPAAQRDEIRSDLKQLSMSPRRVACQTLLRIAQVCRQTASQRERETQAAKKLWPRLGFCAGTLMAILLW